MDEYIGMIKLFSGTYPPKYWAFCDGQILSVRMNAALYSILGTNYGGDGINTFMLPKIDSGVEDVKYIICTMGIYPPRD